MGCITIWIKRNHLAIIPVIARLVVGLTFILAGLGKLPQKMQFVDAVISYHVLPHPIAWCYGVALPWLELIIGLWFLSSYCIRLAAGLSVPLILTFIVANILALMKGKVTCNCFGEIVLAIPTPVALLVDFVLLALITVILLRDGHEASNHIVLRSDKTERR